MCQYEVGSGMKAEMGKRLIAGCVKGVAGGFLLNMVTIILFDNPVIIYTVLIATLLGMNWYLRKVVSCPSCRHPIPSYWNPSDTCSECGQEFNWEVSLG